MDDEARQERFIEELKCVRPVTRNLIESVMLDSWPRSAAVVDFGIDSQDHYAALYYPIRSCEVLPSELDKALGNGSELTRLLRAAPSNPHKDIVFKTSYDLVLDGYASRGREQDRGGGIER